MASAYHLESVSFSYDTAPALRVPELQVNAGEIVALVGPNGAGKTTLLHLLAFVESPRGGTISFFGERVQRRNLVSFRRRVGLLIQHPYLFQTSVLANIAAGLKVRGIGRAERVSRAIEALKWVGLEGFESRKARSLSGGEMQRVALARALVLDPEVLLLDEHANHMDTTSVARIEELVEERNRTKGTTVIYTTHNLQGTGRLAPDRVLLLVDGEPVERPLLP